MEKFGVGKVYFNEKMIDGLKNFLDEIGNGEDKGMRRDVLVR